MLRPDGKHPNTSTEVTYAKITTAVKSANPLMCNAAREVERYCVLPGQACSYKIGHAIWVRGRDRAKAALGSKYDIKDFHEAGLDCGRVPVDILDGVIDRYIKTKAA